MVFAGEGQSVLNPLLNNTDDIQSIIFSGLMKYDGNNKPVTDLAESYEYDEKGCRVVYLAQEFGGFAIHLVRA